MGEQVHRCGVSQGVEGDVFLGDARTTSCCCGEVDREPVFECVAGERRGRRRRLGGRCIATPAATATTTMHAPTAVILPGVQVYLAGYWFMLWMAGWLDGRGGGSDRGNTYSGWI